jgi:hypothetical protein
VSVDLKLGTIHCDSSQVQTCVGLCEFVVEAQVSCSCCAHEYTICKVSPGVFVQSQTYSNGGRTSLEFLE